MPIALLILLSKSLTYIKTLKDSPFEPSRTPYKIILIIPGLVAIASKHRNLTATYYGCIDILTCNFITQSQGTTILYFSFYVNVRYISYLVPMSSSPPGTVMLAVLTSFLSLLFPTGPIHPVYVFNPNGKLVSIAAFRVIV